MNDGNIYNSSIYVYLEIYYYRNGIKCMDKEISTYFSIYYIYNFNNNDYDFSVRQFNNDYFIMDLTFFISYEYFIAYNLYIYL